LEDNHSNEIQYFQVSSNLTIQKKWF
jgi:hypothetical protein